jgi:hypothetical protein
MTKNRSDSAYFVMMGSWVRVPQAAPPSPINSRLAPPEESVAAIHPENSVTYEPAAAEGGALPTALFAIRLYGAVSAVRTAAALIRSDPTVPIQNAVGYALGEASGADPISKFIAGQILDAVGDATKGPDKCTI